MDKRNSTIRHIAIIAYSFLYADYTLISLLLPRALCIA